MKLILATKNKHKAEEITAILGGGFEVITQTEAGVDVDVLEDGDTFEANAIKKAVTTMNLTGLPTIADDSGLVVEALGGLPGVKTARYAGEDATDGQNIDKLLHEMQEVPAYKRGAKFVCVVALANPDGTVKTFCGECHGTILSERTGSGGFGYDPVFLSREYAKSMAQLEPHIKNAISHRGKAVRKLAEVLQ